MKDSPRPQTQETISSSIAEGVVSGALTAGKVAGGAVAGFTLFSSGSSVSAHNEGSSSTTDTPQVLFMEDNDTVYNDALAQGYTHDEVERDLINHGLKSSDQWDNPGLKIGDTWTVSPEVVDSRAMRLGDAKTVTLKKNQTIWGQATKAGVAESEVPELIEWLEDSQGREINENNLPVGFTFTIPETLLKQSQVDEITPLGSGPTTVTVEEGSSIFEELVKEGVSDPMQKIDEVLKANNMDLDDATKLAPGTVIDVPAGIMPDETDINIPEIKATVVTLDEGSTIYDELEKAGISDPIQSIDEVLDANDLTHKEATRLSVGTEITIPGDIMTGSELESSVIQEVIEPVVAVESLEVEATPKLETNLQVEKVPQTIDEVLVDMKSGYETGGVDTAKLVEFIEKNFEHPSIDPENGITEENVHLLYMLPEPQKGFDFTVNPHTCAKEAITSAPMMALVIATQDYAHWLTQTKDEFKHLDGEFRLDIGDFNSGNHKTHQYGLAADLRSIFDDHTDFANPNGPLFMSGRQGYNMKLTEHALKFIQNTTLNGNQFVDHVVISSEELEKNITGANKKGDFIAHDDSGMHIEHIHIKAKEGYSIPEFFSPALPLSCDDPKTGGHTGHQHSSPKDHEVVTSIEEPVSIVEEELPPVVTSETSTEKGYWVLSDNYQEIIDQSNLSAEQKEFLRVTTESMMAAINSGAKINPRVALAQAVVESGWGTGKGAVEGNNIFSVKANRSWALENPDQVVWIYDDEFDNDGNKIESAFKKYSTVEDAFKDYSRMITEAEHYDDAERCRGDDVAYLNALIHELRENCSIGKKQGENGVLSYATNERYVEIINDVIKNSPIDELIVLNPNERQRQAAQEWLLLHE